MFNIDEIFEIAEQIERNGAKFYRKAAENTDDDNAIAMLNELAVMEDDHERRFGEIRQKVAGESANDVYDPEGEAAAYLQSFASGKVFDPKGDPSLRLTGTESIADVLRIAIGLEKESIAFYVGMRELVPAEFGRAKIQSIIREEMGHITLLTNKLKNFD